MNNTNITFSKSEILDVHYMLESKASNGQWYNYYLTTFNSLENAEKAKTHVKNLNSRLSLNIELRITRRTVVCEVMN